jgi:hypothetical protein
MVAVAFMSIWALVTFAAAASLAYIGAGVIIYLSIRKRS